MIDLILGAVAVPAILAFVAFWLTEVLFKAFYKLLSHSAEVFVGVFH